MKYIFLLIFFISQQALGEEITTKYIDEVFARVSKEEKIPEKLLRAVCWSESKFNPEAYNHGDGTGMNHAFGICQVLYKTATEFGFKDANCERSFLDVEDEDGSLKKTSRSYKDCKLFGVYTNVVYGAKFLKSRLQMYDDSWISAIAAYNTGSVKICKTGKVYRAKDHTLLWKCKKGGILNQKYVDDVLQALQESK